MIPEIEKLPAGEIKRYQDDRIPSLMRYLKDHSPYYSKVFEQNGINTEEIRSIEDLSLIPVTTKDQIHRFNDDFICVPPSEIVDIVTTSGTLGDPVKFVMTENDLNRLAYNECLSFLCTGASRDDIFQLMTTIDRRFMAGLAYFLGVRRLGAGIVRVGNGMPELQWDTIQRIKPSIVIAVPSFLLKLIEWAEEHGVDYHASSVKKAVCIGEPLRNPDFSLTTLAGKIHEKWDIELYSTYASTEMATAFTECQYGAGGHHHPELIIVEFLDENDKPVPAGEQGEVTITTLGVEGMPLLRFKTGDVCYHYTEPCTCGRTTMRLGPVIGRKMQMIKFKGTTLYPPALYDILDNINEIDQYIVEVFTNEIGTDEILIRVGCRVIPEGFEKKLKDHFRASLRVAPTIVFQDPGELEKLRFPEDKRKAVTFIDHRNH